MAGDVKIMGNEYLATGFVNVDQSNNPADCRNCLSLLNSLPYYRKVKGRSYELLGLTSGLSLLEIGCGIGDDALRMAKLVTPGGRVVGVDASDQMIEAAAARIPAGLPVEFLRADARNLPFDDAIFARCRVDRTLQHIKRPDEAIAEMVRVLIPGGMLLAYDNDWETFTISGSDRETAGAMERFWADSFMNPYIGRDLERSFSQAGVVDITVIPSVSVITDFDVADRVYNLRQTALRATEQGIVTEKTAAVWLDDLLDQCWRRCFSCSLTAFTVVGKKPISLSRRKEP